MLPFILQTWTIFYDKCSQIVEVSESPQVFAVHPKTWCEHLAEHVNTAPPELAASPPCSVCNDCSESWYCLSCYQVLFRLSYFQVQLLDLLSHSDIVYNTVCSIVYFIIVENRYVLITSDSELIKH